MKLPNFPLWIDGAEHSAELLVRVNGVTMQATATHFIAAMAFVLPAERAKVLCTAAERAGSYTLHAELLDRLMTSAEEAAAKPHRERAERAEAELEALKATLPKLLLDERRAALCVVRDAAAGGPIGAWRESVEAAIRELES